MLPTILVLVLSIKPHPMVKRISTVPKPQESSTKKLPPSIVDDSGRMESNVPEIAGMYFKDADKVIIKKLLEEGRLLVNTQSTRTHSVGDQILH